MGSQPVGISGSRAAAIIGLSQYSTPFTVWQEIQEKRRPGFNAERGYIYEKFTGNAATEFGLAFEDAVVNLTQQAIGHTITHREAAYSLDGQDYVTCHIDGKIDNFTKLYEGKTTNHRAFGFSWGEPGTDRVPTTVQCQAQHNMMCAGLESAHISVLVFPSTVNEWDELGWKIIDTDDRGYLMLRGEWTPNNQPQSPSEWAKVFAQIGNFHQYHIEAKPDTQKILKELYAEFWNKYVVPGVAPDVVDFSDIKKMFTAPKGVLVVDEKMRIAGISAADAMREYKDCGVQLGKKSINSVRREFLKVKILAFVKDQTTVMDDEGQEKIVMRDGSGKKLGQFDGKTYRSQINI